MTAKDLKNALLQEAIQGKLVPQMENEGNAKDLLEEIKKEKAKLIKEGKLKKEKPLPEITDDEIPFDIPENWCWCRLNDIGELNRGRSKHRPRNDKILYENGNIPFIQTGDVAILNIDACFPDSVVGFYGNEKITNNIFVMYCLMWYKDLLDKMSHSTAQKNINLEILSKIAFPLPPLAEQKRIVDAIERFMPLIEEYGKKEAELTALNADIAKTLKNAILQEAVQGKLVPQIASEGNAKDLLDLLLKTKKDLVEKRLIYKKSETEPFYKDDEYPFDIPDSWCWVKLSDISIIQEGAGIRKWQYRDDGTQLLCVTNILNGKVDLSIKKLFIDSDEYKEKYSHLTVNKGDIVCSCSGGSWGKAAIYNCDDTIMMNTSTLRLRFFNDIGNNKFLYYVVQSDFFKNQLLGQLAGMQPNFGYAHYSRICIPLPPYEEQKRIVEVIEKMLPLCEKVGE